MSLSFLIVIDRLAYEAENLSELRDTSCLQGRYVDVDVASGHRQESTVLYALPFLAPKAQIISSGNSHDYEIGHSRRCHQRSGFYERVPCSIKPRCGNEISRIPLQGRSHEAQAPPHLKLEKLQSHYSRVGT